MTLLISLVLLAIIVSFYEMVFLVNTSENKKEFTDKNMDIGDFEDGWL